MTRPTRGELTAAGRGRAARVGCYYSDRRVPSAVSDGRGAMAILELSEFKFRAAIPERVRTMHANRSWCETKGQAKGLG